MAPKFYLAPSLEQLRDQVNSLWPKRDKLSDGWIGDPSHAARKSDHNPDYSAGGIVRAIDIDKDGINVDALLRALLLDARVAYVIWTGRIWTRAKGWQKYTGVNSHANHIHVSIYRNAHGASAGSWNLTDYVPAMTNPSLSKSISQLANEVIEGKYGDGAQRKAALGGKYDLVQAEVTRLLKKTPSIAKSISQLADEVLAGKHGNGDARKRSLGNRYNQVQAEVASRLRSEPRPAEKSIAQLAKETIDGRYGSGDARKRALGSKYNAVQAEVNRQMTSKPASKPRPKPKTTAQLVTEVIAGKHGSGDERKKSLGSQYEAVQAAVNRRLA